MWRRTRPTSSNAVGTSHGGGGIYERTFVSSIWNAKRRRGTVSAAFAQRRCGYATGSVVRPKESHHEACRRPCCSTRGVRRVSRPAPDHVAPAAVRRLLRRQRVGRERAFLLPAAARRAAELLRHV